jgi:Spy/CpxP family protein refolding chaperone
MEKTLRTRLVTALVLVAVFSAGLLVGVAADRSVVAPTDQAGVPADSSAAQTRRVPMWEQVGPNEAQKILIDSIVGEYRSSMKSLHAEFRAAYNPRYQALIDGVRASIKAVLTPEQANAYDSLVAEYERERAERGARDD